MFVATILTAVSTPRVASAQDCATLAQVEGFGVGTPGSAGVPELHNVGQPMVDQPGMGLRITGGAPGAAAQIVVGAPGAPKPLPAYGARLYPGSPFVRFAVALGPDGISPTLISGPAPASPALCGVEFVAQALVSDPSAQGGLAFTAGLSLRFGVGSAASSLFELAGSYVVPEATKTAHLAFALGDLDGNGHPDLVVPAGSLPENADLRVLRQLEDGSLAPPLAHALGVFNNLIDVSSGDVDGDGRLDVVAAHAPSLSAPSAVVLLRGNGDGMLQPVESVGSPPGAAIAAVAVGDVTGDGLDDVVASGWEPLAVAVLPGPLGSGPATPSALIPLPNLPFARGLRLADADADGLLDVFVLAGGADPQVVVARALGAGAFAAPQAWPAGLVNGEAFDVADVDDDGDADAVVITPTAPSSGDISLVLLLNDGTGGLAATLPLDQGQPWVDIDLGDLDGDGLPEIVLRPSPDSPSSLSSLDMLALPNLGGAAFGPMQSLGIGGGSATRFADMDQDGRLDMIALSVPLPLSSTRWVPGAGDGTLDLPPHVPETSAEATRAADLDGDGDLDLVGWPSIPGQVDVALNDGQAGFGAAAHHLIGSNARDLIVADLDLDGAQDIALTSLLGVSVLQGLGDGGFGPAATMPMASARGIRATDIDGDGLPELLVVHDDFQGGLSTLPNLGQLAFGTPVLTPISTPGTHLDAGDLNGDGHSDVVVQNGFGLGAFDVLLGTGAFSFAAPISIPDPLGGGTGQPILLADLDGDADLDVVRRTSFFTRTQVWLNDGAGQFTKAQTLLWDGFARVLSAADVNGDGAPDIIGDGVALALGGGLFAPPQPGSVSYVDGDLDGDGDPDGAALGFVFLNRLY